MEKVEIIKLIENTKAVKGQKIISLLLPGLKFSLDEPAAIKQSRSQIGGAPRIFDQHYPSLNNVPLVFLAQISLDDIHYLNGLLPKSGLLCFFILLNDMDNRFPDRKNEFKVVFVNRTIQGNVNGKSEEIPAFPISFVEQYTFPSYQENLIVKNNISDEDLFLMESLEMELQAASALTDIGHQILGHPNAVQGTVGFWWAAKYLGIDHIDAISQEEMDRINREEDQFVLLLQLDFSDPKIGIEHFGDSVAYFGIHEEDLAKENFDNVILVMQNT
ncbi:MAG: YwqG family protein [Pedobacter agri]